MNQLRDIPLLTPDDLERMPGAERFELVDGVLEERDVGQESNWVGGAINSWLFMHCRAHGLGWSGPSEGGFQCFPGRPNLVRRPDVAFVRAGRYPNDRPPRGHSSLAPDLAVEVVSPNDSAEGTEERVADYLGAGVRLVWVVYPKTRSVTVYRADGSAARLRDGQALDGEDVLPGLHLPLADIFPPPGPPAAPVSPATP